MKNTMIVGVGVFLILIAFIAGLFFQNPFKKVILRHDVLATETHCPYVYINRLRCEPDVVREGKEYISLRNDLLEYIEMEKAKGNVTSVSFYFRDTQNSSIVSINAQESFAPASLLKTPLMITYLKKAEDDPAILQRKVTVPLNIDSIPQDIQPKESAKVGSEYTIEELISLAIIHSDNIAWKLLLNDLRKNYSGEDFIITLSDLGIVDPRKQSDQQYITVQSYASIFRTLYNSSYLSPEMSDKALKILSGSAYKDGIVAGVPEDIEVAHKFGEQRNGNDQQLHDCGIVYYPENPYLLCIMTKGHSIPKLQGVISGMTEKVHRKIVLRE